MATTGLTNSELTTYLGLPQDTITNLQTTQGTQFQAVANEFLNALFNKVIYQQVDRMEFTNPFKKYDSYPINYGDTIENIFVELPSGYQYDRDATNPFERVNPQVKALYATLNYQMQYETTIYDADLRKAVFSEYGFMNLIDAILGALATSKTIDEYYATLTMLNNADIMANGVESITTTGMTSDVKAKTITQKIVDVVGSFQLPSKANNKAQVKTLTPLDRCLLVIKREVLDTINLDYLAGVYNLSKVDLINNIIKVDTFQTEQQVEGGTSKLVGEDIDFMILDTRGFDNHVSLEDGGMIYNPKGKYTNHFYNLWKILSFKYFYNCRGFKIVSE